MLRLRIREVATQKGISMMKLSHRSEVSYSLIRELFADPYHTVTTHTLERIASVLGVSVLSLVEDVSEEHARIEKVTLPSQSDQNQLVEQPSFNENAGKNVQA